MVDYISNTTDVRELARSVIPGEWPDAEIQEEQKAAYNFISIYTHKFDWVSTDPEFPALQKIEAQLAKIYILEHYAGGRYYEQLQAQKAEITMMLDKIVENLVSPTFEDELLITSTDYMSWNLNPDLPYTSKLNPALRNFGTDGEVYD